MLSCLLSAGVGCDDPPAPPLDASSHLDTGSRADAGSSAQDGGAVQDARAPSEPTLGELTEVGPCSAPDGFTCTVFEIRCPNVDTTRVAVRRGNALGPRGG